MDRSVIEKNRSQCHKILIAMDVLEQIYKHEPLNEIDEIFKLYLTQEGATNTAKYLNSGGKRIKTEHGSRAYTSADVLDIIMDYTNYGLVNHLILNLVRKMSSMKNRYKRWDYRIIEVCSETYNKSGKVVSK